MPAATLGPVDSFPGEYYDLSLRLRYSQPLALRLLPQRTKKHCKCQFSLCKDHGAVLEIKVRESLVRERHLADPLPDCALHNVVHTSAEQ